MHCPVVSSFFPLSKFLLLNDTLHSCLSEMLCMNGKRWCSADTRLACHVGIRYDKTLPSVCGTLFSSDPSYTSGRNGMTMRRNCLTSVFFIDQTVLSLCALSFRVFDDK